MLLNSPLCRQQPLNLNFEYVFLPRGLRRWLPCKKASVCALEF